MEVEVDVGADVDDPDWPEPPLTILATLAAFIMAIVFRQMARHPDRAHRWFLTIWLIVTAATLFADFRYVRRYRSICDSLQQQMEPSRQD